MLQFSKSLKCGVKLQCVMNPPHTGRACTFPCSPRDLSVLLRREKQYLWALLRAGLNRVHFIRRKRSDITSKLVLFIKSYSPLLMTRQLLAVIKEGGGGIVCGTWERTPHLSCLSAAAAAAPKPILTRAPHRRLKGTACLSRAV